MPETRRSFDEQLEDIRTDVVKLAAKSCEQIGAATQALLDADLPLVERIYAEHEEIEGRVLHVEQRVYQLFALQQPMASDLRDAARGAAHPARDRAHGRPDAQRRRARPAGSTPASSRPGSAASSSAWAPGERADAPRRRRVRRRRRQRSPPRCPTWTT